MAIADGRPHSCRFDMDLVYCGFSWAWREPRSWLPATLLSSDGRPMSSERGLVIRFAFPMTSRLPQAFSFGPSLDETSGGRVAGSVRVRGHNDSRHPASTPFSIVLTPGHLDTRPPTGFSRRQGDMLVAKSRLLIRASDTRGATQKSDPMLLAHCYANKVGFFPTDTFRSSDISHLPTQ